MEGALEDMVVEMSAAPTLSRHSAAAASDFGLGSAKNILINVTGVKFLSSQASNLIAFSRR